MRVRTVSKFPVLSDVREYSNDIASIGTEVVEKLSCALIAVRIRTEGVNDPDLAKVHGCGKGSRLWVTRNEFDVLYSTSLEEVSTAATCISRRNLRQEW